ncbi:hypothetical protein IQ265_05010 [Nodosilinea sp. LEGE 06152]|uniref:hypothetical protein n=1 Tax=Nodosilinea sp. LEGE 06152 TaxID=2777966 RepID=UPI00187E7102|nr:hypothetical protein [Nodosilinea sp. LEGE 06152]MBE9156190.1 hypothetical protein [Nodosilinea sp. LEGE 06152]
MNYSLASFSVQTSGKPIYLVVDDALALTDLTATGKILPIDHYQHRFIDPGTWAQLVSQASAHLNHPRERG